MPIARLFPTVAAATMAAAAFFSAQQPIWARQTPPAPHVAIFAADDFPYYGTSTLVTPQQIAAELRAAGVAVDLLDASALADPQKLTNSHYEAVVLPYGNTYPKAAFANLRHFHQGGGSLVTTGIPFTHAVTETIENGRPKWTDQDHESAPALWGPDGIGVGGFAGPVDQRHPEPMTISVGDPLQLAGCLVGAPTAAPTAQWLDRVSIPPGDTIVPAVGTAERPLVALITHHGDGFDGAIDAWTYRTESGDAEDYDERQMIERGTIAVLARRGRLSEARRVAALKSLDGLPRPTLYANLTLPTPPRPYSTFQPKMPPPARHLYVADIRKFTPDEKLLFISLQGIVNRTQPRIYLLLDDFDRQWLDELQHQHETDAPIKVSSPWTLFDTFRKSVKGAVVCDPAIYDSPCVGVCLAGADDLVIAKTADLAKQVKLPVKEDLRGRFKDDADALRYIRTKLLPRLNPYLTICGDPHVYTTGSIDQIIAARGSAFWITGPKAQSLPGANQAGEMSEVKAMLASMPLGAVVRGFWWHGGGMGMDETEGVALGSRFGKITLVSDLISNLSVHSGVPATHLVQKPRPQAPPLDRSKVYFAFTMSDGDNLCTWREYFRKYFEDPVRGSVPVGWGMGPSLVDLAPDWARWYYDRATPNDEFICDVSGVAYMYPSSWGSALKDRDAAFRYYYGRTNEYMRRMDMKSVRLMNVDAPDIARVGPLLPDVEFLLPDYGYGGEHSYDQLTYTLPTGQVIFRAATNGKGSENLADQIRKRAGASRPAFVNAFIWNWGSTLSDLKKVMELLGPGYVAVTPSQLNSLYRAAAR